MKALFALALVACALIPRPAHALRLSLVGAAGWSTPQTNPEGNFSAKSAYGYGALLEFGLVPTLGLEIGALNLPRIYQEDNYAQVKQSQIMVPVVLRAHLLDIISLGVGGYYSHYSGNLEYSNSASGGSYPTDYGAAGFSKSDYGVVTSLGVYYDLSPGARLVFDGRYLIGMKDNDDTYYTRKFRDIQFLAGLQLGF